MTIILIKETGESIERTISGHSHWHQVSIYSMSQRFPTLAFNKRIMYLDVFSDYPMSFYFKEKNPENNEP